MMLNAITCIIARNVQYVSSNAVTCSLLQEIYSI